MRNDLSYVTPFTSHILLTMEVIHPNTYLKSRPLTFKRSLFCMYPSHILGNFNLKKQSTTICTSYCDAESKTETARNYMSGLVKGM